jgi:uncharacterized protein (TIGR02265 family)
VLAIPAATFEGLFVRGLVVDEPLRQRLRHAGFDASTLQLSYPVTVWQTCVMAAREHCFGAMAHAEAEFLLGQKFNHGFLDTMVGSIIKVGLPLLGLKRVAARLPRTMPSAFPGVKVVVDELTDGLVRVSVSDSPISADFARGVFVDAGRMLRQQVTTAVDSQTSAPALGHAFTITAHWQVSR